MSTRPSLRTIDSVEFGPKDVVRHDPDDPTSVSSDRAWSLHEDEWGHLWVGTDRGLTRYEPRTDDFANDAPHRPYLDEQWTPPPGRSAIFARVQSWLRAAPSRQAPPASTSTRTTRTSAPAS